ncbi:MAG: aldo/keto reductase [Verrucomicrobia bacterium]|nr:aldo/keto reductase [Verrucomicrobiota bacterium]
MGSSPIEVDAARCLCRIEGTDYPAVGFGTYPLTGEVCSEAVKNAVDAGYRMIDTATSYGNFPSIAKGLKGKDRSRLYLNSKVWHDKLRPEDLHQDLEETLQLLETNYIDAYFMHWPNRKIPIKDTLRAMEEEKKKKRIRHIGLSNVTVNHLRKALEVGVPITWVQVEMHPYYYDPQFLDFCRKNSIVVQAWRPLNLGRIGQDELLHEIGKKHGKTACQVALRWLVQHGCIPIPGSKSKNHMQENIDIANFLLSDEEMKKLNERAAAGTRFRLKLEYGLGFTDEFDLSYEECWPK